MIHYALRCGRGHGFDGWFRHSAAFEAQAADGSLVCPTCADCAIQRAPMSPKIGRRRGKPEASVAAPAASPAASSAETMPDGLRAVLQRMRAEVERRCDYVGPAFAETVRAMHQGEAPARGVYGEASPEEASALREDGIEVASIPWVKRADA